MKDSPIALRDALPFVTTLFGAFLGALGAFLVGWWKEKRDETKRRHTALLAAQYALYSQWSILEDIRRSFLESVRKDPNRCQKQKYFIRTFGELTVPFDELTFVIDSKDPNLLQEIHVAEKWFLSSVSLLERLNNARLEIHKKYPPLTFDVESGVGPANVPVHEVFELIQLTDLLYKNVDQALPDSVRTNERIAEFIKRNFKNRKGAKFIPLEDSKPPTTAKV